MRAAISDSGVGARRAARAGGELSRSAEGVGLGASSERSPSIASAVGYPQTVQCNPVGEIGCSQMGQLEGTEYTKSTVETETACLISSAGRRIA